MRTNPLHFSGDMLGIAGTPPMPTQHDLPLASQGCDQLASYLQDETRCSGQLLDDCDMLLQRFGNPVLHVHTRDPFSL